MFHYLFCKYAFASPLQIVCSPIEHHDASEFVNSPTHSLISDSSTIVASNPNPDIDIEQTLTELEKASSDLIPHMINMPNLPNLSNPNLAITMVNDHFSSATPNNHSPYANALKTPRPGTPSSHSETNDNAPPKKRFNMMQDDGYINSGHMPPILHPLPNPSKLSTVSAEYIYANPEFKHTLPAYYMTPTNYQWQVKTRKEDHYVQYASRNIPQFKFWHDKFKSFQIQCNFLKSSKHDLGSDPNVTTPAPVKRKHHRTYEQFIKHKYPQIIYSKIQNSSLLIRCSNNIELTLKLP